MFKRFMLKNKKKSLFFCLTLITIVLFGCDSTKDQSFSLDEDRCTFDQFKIQIKELKNEISNLKYEVNNLSKSEEMDGLSEIKEEIKRLNDESVENTLELFYIKRATMPNPIVINLKESSGFCKINTEYGIFLVGVKETTPYLGGYKVKFKIGNITSAEFFDPKIKLKWNRSYEKYSQLAKEKKEIPCYKEWSANAKEKEYSISKKLEPNTWNIIEVFIDAPIEELDYVKFSIEELSSVTMFSES